jgi:hypothetical protein
MWQKAWIDGQYIVLDCVPNEIEKYHLNDLKLDVQNTNDKYKEHLREKEREQINKEKVKEKDDISNLRNRLKFD